MAAIINSNYGQFYKGTEQIQSYGSGSGKKDTLVRYEFNTTDEKGNKVMDKMTKEETFRTMNEISAQYGDNVIVEFSGDALTVLEQYGKGLLREPAADREPIPVEYLEGPHALTEEELQAIKDSKSKLGDDMVAIMHDADPDAYREYNRISEEGIASGTKEGMTAGFRYLFSWMDKKVHENPKWLEEYKAGQKTETDAKVEGRESGLSEKAAAFLANLRKKYGDFDFVPGNAGDDLRSLVRNSSKEFSVIISTEELERMAADGKYAEEKMNEVNGAVRMSRQINEQFGFGKALADSIGNGVRMTKFGICFHDDGSVSYFAELEKSSAKQKELIERASSEAELIDRIRQIHWSETKEERQTITGSRFDYSV